MSYNKDLAQEIILDHNKSPYHREVPQSYTHNAKGENKQRGDKIEVYLTIENDQIKRASFWGNGGAVFTASASIMAKLNISQEIVISKFAWLLGNGVFDLVQHENGKRDDDNHQQQQQQQQQQQ